MSVKRQFVEQFRQVMHLNSWDEEEGHFALKAALSRPAAKGLNTCTTCDAIFDRPLSKFRLTESDASQFLKRLQ